MHKQFLRLCTIKSESLDHVSLNIRPFSFFCIVWTESSLETNKDCFLMQTLALGPAYMSLFVYYTTAYHVPDQDRCLFVSNPGIIILIKGFTSNTQYFKYRAF